MQRATAALVCPAMGEEATGPLERMLRKQSRVELSCFATVAQDDALIPAEVTELSLGGVRLRCPQRLPVGSACLLTIQLTNRREEHLPVDVDAEVVRHDEQGMILSLRHIHDSAGFEMLCNLVLLHTGDPARAARELSRLRAPDRKQPPDADAGPDAKRLFCI